MTLEGDLLALERRVLIDAAGSFLIAVEELRRMVAAGEPGIQRRLASIAVTDFDAVIRNGVLDAHQRGAARASSEARRIDAVTDGDVGEARRAAGSSPDPEVLSAADGLAVGVAAAVATSLTLLSVGSPPDEGLAPVFQAANTVRRTVTSQINLAANQAVHTVADEVGYPVVWQAERDACVYCLALSGTTVGVGEVFPDASRYAPQPRSYGAILEPPRHANCRCTLAVLGDPSYADALRREADRSILRGFSLRSESNAVRVRAAARLLQDPSLVAPKSVKAYAANAVKRGKFGRGRDVPRGGPTLVIK